MTVRRPPVSIADFRVRQLEPNLTAILPGKCQARCAFCIEPEGPDPRSSEEWLRSFETLIDRELPSIFRILSISGGEPSLSPVFERLLRLLARFRESGRLKRVVLTTNGSVKGLTRHLDALGEGVTHVNISRHSGDDIANARVFKTKDVPDRKQLADLISQMNHRGLPVNFNCVYSSDHAFGKKTYGVTREELRVEAKRFITFAKDVGASSVVFRHDHRDPHLERSTALEDAFDDYKVVHHVECAACRVVGKMIRGMPVNFKRSVYEPTETGLSTELYELVFHSDGGLYRDWSRLHPVRRPLPATTPTSDWDELRPRPDRPSALPVAECDAPQSTCNLMVVVKEQVRPRE